ncbi:hypothetical protein [Sulfitobacter sp. R18_1]|uniref:hypothetical protein n=1 Tax=Sulfitobacter sp. R18_1 TaxID=2821104 RepID=UPI001ADA54C7|nr:hypothetical protein [Sulfitobacter sp. R18_1]MBO9428725.1 hypothetical protein [Sulfitobacter sp. R18_1]
MIDNRSWDAQFETKVFGGIKDILRTRFGDKSVTDNVVGAILERYKSQPAMIRDRVHAAATLFEMLRHQDSGGFSEQEASVLEISLRPSMLKLSESRPEY